jgi:class 3 adenylate cyclase
VAPETEYAKSGELSIAFQVVGDGPLDILFAPGFVSHLEVGWEEPHSAAFIERLASFARLILFDKRGTGMSDPVDRPPTLEERTDDIRAVMDAVGSERAAVLGVSEGGAMSTLFAATYPERTTALILYGTYARLPAGPDYPEGVEPAILYQALDGIITGWGNGSNIRYWGPDYASDAPLVAWWGKLQRMSASPSMARNLVGSYGGIDVRGVLDAIRVPTLVLHRRRDQSIPFRLGRYVADHIEGSTFVQLEGADHLFFLGDAAALLDEVEAFLTGVRRGPDPDRVLATVLFVDIVGSTELASTIGDLRWTQLLESYYRVAARQVERFAGTQVRTIGDGILATFDGPGRAVRCALAIRDAVRALGIEVRAGLHTGEIELLKDDVGGIGVHIAARVIAAARPEEVLASSTVKDLVFGSGIEFESRGEHQLKGVPGTWPLFAVLAA